jgi:hypothetical protein
VVRDRVVRLARAQLAAEPQRPWEGWREEKAVADVLRLAGVDRRAVREAFGLVLADYLSSREPAKGLASYYALQALLVVEQTTNGTISDMPYQQAGR